jgi:hypothetical protein
MITYDQTLLTSARFGTSKNESISTVFGMLQAYNSGEVAENDKPAVLERMLGTLGAWVTSHQPKDTALNELRWDAMEHLAQAIADEAAVVGVRLLSGPADWKKIGEKMYPQNPRSQAVVRSYWLEYVDPMHRPGFYLAEHYKRWRDQRKTKADAYVSFWAYLRTNTKGSTSVDYYEANQMAERSKCLVLCKVGKLRKAHDDSLLSTNLMTTVESGDGWGIFVLSPEVDLYVGEHVEGERHHSTFLAGGAVMAAGELTVERGDVKVITAKSGHYMPSRQNMHTLVNRLPQLAGDAIILPDFTKKPTPAYRVRDFRADINCATTVKRSDIVKELPSFLSGKGPTWFANVAD